MLHRFNVLIKNFTIIIRLPDTLPVHMYQFHSLKGYRRYLSHLR